jgi:hypothetical protein
MAITAITGTFGVPVLTAPSGRLTVGEQDGGTGVSFTDMESTNAIFNAIARQQAGQGGVQDLTKVIGKAREDFAAGGVNWSNRTVAQYFHCLLTEMLRHPQTTADNLTTSP